MEYYKFHDCVYEKPFAPYYDAYKGHTFIIEHASSEDETGEHVWLECVSDKSVKVQGYVHKSELIKVEK